jgi:hypothetical protein
MSNEPALTPTDCNPMSNTTGRAWFELRRFLREQTSDRELASWCASEIHGPVCMFGNAQRQPRSKKLGPGPATRPLERLERTVKSGGVEWAKAWHHLTRAALDCLRSGNPGKPVPLTGGVPNPADIAPLIPGALAFARRRGKALVDRNLAIVVILRAFQLIFKKQPTAKPASTFIAKIEIIYGELLPPGGFSVGQTTALQKLMRDPLLRH